MYYLFINIHQTPSTIVPKLAFMMGAYAGDEELFKSLTTASPHQSLQQPSDASPSLTVALSNSLDPNMKVRWHST